PSPAPPPPPTPAPIPTLPPAPPTGGSGGSGGGSGGGGGGGGQAAPPQEVLIGFVPPAGGGGTVPGGSDLTFLAAAVKQPGDRFDGSVMVRSRVPVPFRYSLTTGGVPVGGLDNRLFTDAAFGLQMQIKRNNTVIYEGPVQVNNRDMNIVVNPNTSDELSVAVRFPFNAPNNFQGLRTLVTFTWTAVETH
ncbi:MAG: hypothetical protein NTZ05_11520, partial [Chloroflexi bacterium]|nr:hypothetical protein [Chloroflexota bacterium]